MKYYAAVLSGLMATLTMGEATANTVNADTALINLGAVAVPPDLPSSRETPFFTKVHSTQPICHSTDECQSMTVSWSPMDTSANAISERSLSITALDNSGFGASLKFSQPQPPSGQPQPGQSVDLEIGLLKLADGASSEFSTPLFKRVVEYRSESGELQSTRETLFTLQGNTVVSSCLLTTQALTIRLPVVTSQDIAATSAGKRIAGKSAHVNLQAICSGVEHLSVQFASANMLAQDATLLAANLDSGQPSGLAFQLLYEQDGIERPIHWDNSHGIDVLQPAGVVVPISAHYVREGNALGTGQVSANGTFTLHYR